MDRARFRDWVPSIDELTAAQHREAAAVLSDPPEGEASLAAIGPGVGNMLDEPLCRAVRHPPREKPLRHRAAASRETAHCGRGEIRSYTVLSHEHTDGMDRIHATEIAYIRSTG